jgi:uncharacterized protein YukE
MDLTPAIAAADGRVAAESAWMLRGARDRLRALIERTGRAADEVRWESPSARAFDDAADGVRRTMATVEDLVDDAAMALARAAGAGAGGA